MPFDPTSYKDVDYALDTLKQQWGEEWRQLSGMQGVAVLTDFAKMVAGEEWDSVHDACVEYQKRIFVGNLLDYANCLEAQREY